MYVFAFTIELFIIALALLINYLINLITLKELKMNVIFKDTAVIFKLKSR